MEKPNNANIYSMDEARIGLDFSMLAMKTDVLWNCGRISDGDAMQALIKGAEYGASKASAQSTGGTYRYQNNASYWTDFFGKSAGSSRLGAYESPDSTFQKYLAGWTDFKNSLDRGDSARMNLYS